MKNTTIVILCALMISFIGCQISKNIEIEGVYSAKKNLNLFEFFSDSTFIYRSTIFYGSSFVNKYSEGTWSRINNNSIVINSRIKKNLVPVCIVKSESDKNQICTNLVITQTKIKNPRWGEYTDKDYLVIPYINGKNYLDLHPELSDEPVTVDLMQMIRLNSAKSKSVINVPPVKRGNYCLSLDEPVRDIYFEIEKQPKTLTRRTYYSLKTERVNILMQPNESFMINIALNDSLFSYRIFDNEILEINNKKLIFRDKEDNKTNKLLSCPKIVLRKTREMD